MNGNGAQEQINTLIALQELQSAEPVSTGVAHVPRWHTVPPAKPQHTFRFPLGKGRPLKDAIPMHTPTIADLLSMVDLAQTDILKFEGLEPGTPEYTTEARKVQQGIIDKYRMGDVPGGLVQYFLPDVRQRYVTAGNDTLNIGGRFISTRGMEAPDSVKIYNLPSETPYGMLEKIFHESIHTSEYPQQGGRTGFKHTGRWNTEKGKMEEGPYPQNFYRYNLVPQMTKQLMRNLNWEQIMEILNSISSGEDVDIRGSLGELKDKYTDDPYGSEKIQTLIDNMERYSE